MLLSQHALLAAPRPRRLNDSTINTIPMEILREIFVQATASPACFQEDGNSGDSARMVVTISQVCQDWRLMAVNSSNLWAFVRPGMSLMAIDEFASRSRSWPLDGIVLDLSSQPQPKKTLERVLREVHRARGLHLATSLACAAMLGPEALHAIMGSEFPNLSAPILETFTLMVRPSPDDTSSEETPTEKERLLLPDVVFRGKTPKLACVHVDAPFFLSPSSSILCDVVSLEINGIDDILLFKIMLCAPRVERVSSEIDYRFESHTLSTPVPALASPTNNLIFLHSINMGGTGICPHILAYLLERIPNLQRLDVRLDNPSDAELELGLNPISLPQLKAATLAYVNAPAFPILFSSTPWKDAGEHFRLDTRVILDWQLTYNDRRRLYTFFDTPRRDPRFDTFVVYFEADALLEVGAMFASSIKGDVASDPFATDLGHLQRCQQQSLVVAFGESMSDAGEMMETFFEDIFQGLTQSHADSIHRLHITSAGKLDVPKFKTTFCDTADKWWKLLARVPNVNVLAVDVSNIEDFFHALRPRDGVCVVPRLEKLIIRATYNLVYGVQETLDGKCLDPHRLCPLLETLSRRREFCGVKRLSSLSFVGVIGDSFPLVTEEELRVLKDENHSAISLRVHCDDTDDGLDEFPGVKEIITTVI